MKFDCEIKNKNIIEKWSGNIKKLINYGSHYEIFVESRFSILILLGRTSSGGSACMPDFKVVCHLVNLDDIFGNTEKLTGILGEVDGTTVAVSLATIKNKLLL